MSTRTRNGKTAGDLLSVGTDGLAKDGNPFLRPAWAKPLAPEISLPPAPGVASSLTKKHKLIYQEGQAQLLQQHFQRIKTGYALAASAQVEDFANRCYVQVGTNMVLRKRSTPFAELQPYLTVMMDAQLARMGQEFNQIASDHARTQNAIASQVIEIDEEELKSFWAKLLRPPTKTT